MSGLPASSRARTRKFRNDERLKADTLDALDQGRLGGSVRDVGGVPGDDMFRPAGEGPPERAHFDGVVTIGHVGDEALDPLECDRLACRGLIAVCVELPDGLFGMPDGGHFPRGSPTRKRRRSLASEASRRWSTLVSRRRIRQRADLTCDCGVRGSRSGRAGGTRLAWRWRGGRHGFSWGRA